MARDELRQALTLRSQRGSRLRRLALGLSLLALVMTFLAKPVSAGPAARPAFAPFSFALLGDPQIGYGPGGEYADAARFEEVVEGVNAKKVPFAVIPGDLVQDRSFWQHFAFDRVLAGLETRALLAVGNHDVLNARDLAAYREAYGKDYYDFVHNDCAFLVLNSETARDTRISRSEFDAQWRWIETTLERHRTEGRQHIVLIAHRPPFEETEGEDASARNWPLDTRTRLLTLARRYGVRWFLAGHLHENVLIEVPDGLSIAVVAGSSRSFDESPVGFRLFSVEAERMSQRWVTVADAPEPPFTVPGFHEWTPRLFDFSIRHWVLTLFYAGAGAAAWRAGKRLRGRTRARWGLWPSIAALLFFFGANMQLDLDEFLRDIGRGLAKVTGIEPVRHLVTGSALVVGGVFSTWWLVRRWATSTRDRLTTLALALCAVPAAWFILSAISHHDIGMLFNEGWWDVANVLALAAIAACAVAQGASSRFLGRGKS